MALRNEIIALTLDNGKYIVCNISGVLISKIRPETFRLFAVKHPETVTSKIIFSG